MRTVFFCDFSTHYMMGDSYAMVKFTPKQFEVMINLMKEAEEEDFQEGQASDKMEEVLRALEAENKVHLYGLSLLQYSDMFGKKSPKQVMSILEQGKTVSGDWEEGSFAFATTAKKAESAVCKIEAMHIGDDW